MNESSVLALVADLLFASRIRGAATAAGVAARAVRTEAALLDAIGTDAPRLVLIDLETRSADAIAAIRAIRSLNGEQPAVIAFGPHTSADVLRAARDAGADRVLARSAFVRDLPALLAEVRNSAAGGAA